MILAPYLPGQRLSYLRLDDDCDPDLDHDDGQDRHNDDDVKTHLLLLPFQASAHTWTQAAPGNCNHIIIFFSQTRISFTFISYFIHTLILY